MGNTCDLAGRHAIVTGGARGIGREVVGKGVLLNGVAHGPIDTGMIGGLGPEAVDRMVRDSPMGRLGEPREVAALVAWLCTDASGYSTGAVFDMSGGRARY